MNSHTTQKPTEMEKALAAKVSDKASRLVRDFATEVGDSHEWPNVHNVRNTRTALLAYIAQLESRVRGGSEDTLKIQTLRAMNNDIPPVGKPDTSAPLGAHGTTDRFPWEPNH